MSHDDIDEAGENILGMLGTTEGLALALAVLHHGLSCHAVGSIPAKVGTVLHTAEEFETRLSDRRGG